MKIIIVDDEELAQKRLLQMLKELDYSDVKVAKDGYEALELIKTTPFDIIFLDIDMPQADGLELGRKIKTLFKDKALIYQSAYAQHALDAFDVGAVGYLVKPYDLKQLKKNLQRVQTKAPEYLAKEKIEAGIINDLNPDAYVVFHKAADVLSGDFYSVYKLKNGAFLIFVIDAQGHGISPALTVFAVSSMLGKVVYDVNSLEELIERVSPLLRTFLAEEEQLSYTMALLHQDGKTLHYASGGMYPFLVKRDSKVERFKANNPPFMNFSQPPKVNMLEIDRWQGMLFYSDGIVEHNNTELMEFAPHLLLDDTRLLAKAFDKLEAHTLEDDVTILYIENKDLM